MPTYVRKKLILLGIWIVLSLFEIVGQSAIFGRFILSSCSEEEAFACKRNSPPVMQYCGIAAQWGTDGLGMRE